MPPTTAGLTRERLRSRRTARDLPQSAGKKRRAAKTAAYAERWRAALSAAMLMVDDDTRHKLLFGLNMIRGRHLANDMSQKELGDILGVDRRDISRWERGHEPRPPRRKQIADALGQTMDFFYDESVLKDLPSC